MFSMCVGCTIKFCDIKAKYQKFYLSKFILIIPILMFLLFYCNVVCKRNDFKKRDDDRRHWLEIPFL